MSSTSTSRCKLHNIIKLLKGKTTKGIGKLIMMKMMRMMVMSRFLLWKRIWCRMRSRKMVMEMRMGMKKVTRLNERGYRCKEIERAIEIEIGYTDWNQASIF
jgi:hypothetical protein